MKRFYKDERGSSLVLTIVAMAFISLLAVAVISMTVTNIRLKIAQKGSQKNFYNTDSIMDEVRAGVEDLAAQAAVDAYMEAFTYYSASQSGTPVNMEDKYKKKFLEQMIEKLSDGQRHYGQTDLLYKDEVLKNYLIARVGLSPSVDRYLLHNNTDAPGMIIDSKTYGHMDLENDTLLLRDIKITMTEGTKNYKTTLTSDIRVTIPPMTADTYSEYLNYALIADNQIIADANSSVNGSMYAGTVKRFQSGGSETGILVHGGYTMNVKANNVVTRGDLMVDGGSKFFLNGLNGLDGMPANLWAENIFTRGNSANTMTLTDVICNVSDDMEVGGKNDNVTITGQYIGYNYNASYKDATELKQVTKESKYSSAILINGMGANLDLSGLNTLVLSGKTFISKKTDAGELNSSGGAIINPDIAMGESLSVKGAQIAYYVPADFVKITTGVTTPSTGNNTAKREYTFHRASDPTTEYTFDYGGYLKYLCNLDPQTATDAEVDQKLAAKGITNFDLLSYLDAGQPLELYYRHNMAVQTDAVTYFYLNFKSDAEMMKFYPVFKDNFTRYSTVKDTNAAYMGTTGIKIKDTGDVVYCISGNILYKDPSSTGDTKIKLANEAAYLDSQMLQKYAQNKTLKYMSMQLSLVENYELAKQTIDNGQFRLLDYDANLSKSGATDKTNLYNVLIDETEMTNVKNSGSGTREERIDVGGSTNDKAMVIIEPTTSTYTWNSTKHATNATNKGIIIAAGDVEVADDFEGLIIAGGDIKLTTDGVTVSANNVLLEDMFTEDKVRDNPKFYNLFSQYFQKAVNTAIGQDDDATDDVVFYERWKKE